MKRFFAVLLVCAMFLPILASCGSLQAGELDVESYPQTGDKIQNIADASTVTGYEGRTELDTSGGEYHKEGEDWVGSTYEAQTENLTGTYDTYTGRTSGSWVTKTFTQWWGVDGEFSADVASKNINGTGVKETIDGKEYYVFEIGTAEQLAGFFRMLNYPDALAEGETIDQTVADAFSTDPTAAPRYDFSNAYIKLIRDIDMGGTAADAMQKYTMDGSSYFNGVFDGQGHVVRNRCSTSAKSYGASIFGGLVNATIKDVAFIDCTFTDTGKYGASGLAVWSAGKVTISNVYLGGSIVGGKGNSGGLIGVSYGGTIDVDKVTVDIEIGKDTLATGNTISGMIGWANGTSVSIANSKVICDINVANTLKVTSATMVPSEEDANVPKKDADGNDMYTLVAETGGNTQYSGFVASWVGNSDTDQLSISNCEASGSITALATRMSGFVSRAQGNYGTVILSNLKSDVDISIGNIVVPTATGKAYYNDAGEKYTVDDYTISGENVRYIGGIVGLKEGTSGFRMQNCFNYGTLEGCKSVGGIIGAKGSTQNSELLIDNCHNMGDVTGLNGGRIGGVIGELTQATSYEVTGLISNCTNSGTVVSGNSYTGGIIGFSGSNSTDWILRDCTNYGDVTGTTYVSGVLGIGGDATTDGKVIIDGCINKGDITFSGNNVGGILGDYQGIAIELIDCVNEGNLTPTQYKSGYAQWVGGIAGYIHGGKGDPIDTVLIKGCVNTGTIIANRSSGGVVAYVQNATDVDVLNCTVAAKLDFRIYNTTNPYVGGVAGLFCENGDVLVDNCVVKGELSLADYVGATAGVGGIVGNLRNSYGDSYPNFSSSTVCVQNCVVGASFTTAGENAEDTNEKAGVFCANVDASDYIAVTFGTLEYVKMDDTSIAVTPDAVSLGEGKATAQSIGSQWKKNDDGTYSMRYIFGVSGLTAVDKALGFNVTLHMDDGSGYYTKEITVYCPNIYTAITDNEGTVYATNEYESSEGENVQRYDVDYFFTLVISDIPAEQIGLISYDEKAENVKAYIKNAYTVVDAFIGGNNFVEATQTVSLPEEHNVITLSNADSNNLSFTGTLPTAYQTAYTNGLGVMADTNEIEYYEGLSSSVTSKVAGCYTVYRIGEYQVYIARLCQEDHTHYYEYDGKQYTNIDYNGVVAFRADKDVARYHLYFEPSQWGSKVKTLPAPNEYNQNVTVTFEVDAAGLYEFCFLVRMQTSGSRWVQIQVNDQPYSEQTIINYKASHANGAVITENQTAGTANYLDSYISGFSAQLKKGTNTITFRAPYKDSISYMHIRDFYVVKSEVPEANIHTFQADKFSPTLPDVFGTSTKTLSNGNVTFNDTLKDGVIKIDNNTFKEGSTANSSVYYYTWNDTGAASSHGGRSLSTASDTRGVTHYYIDMGNANKALTNGAGQKISALRDCYIRWSFTIEEAGTYDFCFNVRANSADPRYALIQFDNQPITESYVLTWQSGLTYSDSIRDTYGSSDDGTNGSYLSGFSQYFEAGEHTITFRIAYHFDGTSYGNTSSWHFRNIYLVKSTAE